MLNTNYTGKIDSMFDIEALYIVSTIIEIIIEKRYNFDYNRNKARRW